MNHRSREEGKIIAVTGMDGSGKSTVSSIIQEYLKQKGKEFIVTKQPMNPIKEWICFRKLLNNECKYMNFSTIGGLIAWGRLNTQINEIEPALNENKIIICERYITDITVWSIFRKAKQCWINNWTNSLLNEDYLFLCDSNAEVIFERLKKRKEKDKIGEDNLTNIIELVELYRKISKERNAYIINTNLDVETVKVQIEDILSNILK